MTTQHRIVFAAPLSCKSYDGQRPFEAVQAAMMYLRAHGFDMKRKVLRLRDERRLVVWSNAATDVAVAACEDKSGRFLCVTTSASRESVVAGLAKRLTTVLPLVEISRDGYQAKLVSVLTAAAA